MKKYWVSYWLDFGNTYSLYWTASPEDEKALPDSAQRITRKEAISLAAQERQARKYDPSFSGYADAYIYPANITEEQRIARQCDPTRYTIYNPYIVEI